MGVKGKFDIVVSPDCRFQSLSILFLFWTSWKHYLVVFLLLFEQMEMINKYICGSLPFTALKVNPTDNFRSWETQKCERSINLFFIIITKILIVSF